MAHRVTARAEADLDDIWYYVAKESGSIEIANRLIDSITGRFSLGLPERRPRPRRGFRPRFVHGRRDLEALFGR